MPDPFEPTARLHEQLWQVVLTNAGIPIHPGCESYLRELIANGVSRMVEQGRVSADDIAMAESSLSQFIALMKEEAIRLKHPESLGEDTFEGAIIAVTKKRQSLIAGFELWPFWPPPWSP